MAWRGSGDDPVEGGDSVRQAIRGEADGKLSLNKYSEAADGVAAKAMSIQEPDAGSPPSVDGGMWKDHG
jgi:hypothetical protein